MPTFELSLTLKQDGIAVPGTPITTRLTVDEVATAQLPIDNTASFITIGSIPVLNAVILRPYDRQVTVRLDAQSDAGIVVNAGGLLVVFNGELDAGATTNVKVKNDTVADTDLLMIEGGSQT